MLAHLDLQGALEDEVAFLALVGGELDGPALRLGAVGGLDVERLGDAVLEVGSQVVVGQAVGLLDLPAPSGPGEGVGPQLGALALDEVRDVHAEGEGAPVEEREVQILLARLAPAVLLLGDGGLFGHLRNGETADLPQFPDTPGHFPDLVVQSGHTLHLHGCLLLGTQKHPSQS